MAIPLLTQLDQWMDRAASSRHLLVMLDFDGTLTPIVPHPDMAHLSQQTRRTLQTLSRCLGVTVAIVSGRRLCDVRSRVGLTGLTYAGNHGLEIGFGDFQFIEPGAAQSQLELTTVCDQLARAVADIPGAWVEDKGLTATLHFRSVSAEHIPQLQSVMCEVDGTLGERFYTTPSRAAFEIRPRINWNKGSAAQWLRRSLNGYHPLSIFIGDDLTDEDAFRVIPDGLTVHVGESAETIARYTLPGPPEVQQFLTWLTSLRR